VMVIVFGEKYVSLLKLTRSTPKVLDETQPSGASFNTVQLFSADVIRSMKPDEQFEYYTRIIQKYTALRLQLNSGDSSYSSRAETEEGRRNSRVPQSPAGPSAPDDGLV
jgi:hypothetical protein